MLWAARSATALKKWPLLRLLWKAAPRKCVVFFVVCGSAGNNFCGTPGKCHSKDVEGMVEEISKTSRVMAASIHSIHKASLLGNYAHAKKRPPLPLRFSIYRKAIGDLNKEASSKHPFFLYALKEFLISAVADDFGLRCELYRNPLWKDFEDRVSGTCFMRGRLLIFHFNGVCRNRS